MTFQGLYNIRECKETDKALVLSTFLKGLYYGESLFSEMPKNLFMDRYKLVARALVSDPNTVVRIACLPDDEDVILGYSIVSRDNDTVYYCYTKTPWRQRGIARSLLPPDPKYIAHLTKDGRMLRHKLPNAKFNPLF